MWVTAGAFVLSILAMAVLRLEGAGRPARDKRPEGWFRGGRGTAVRLEQPVLRTLGLIDLAVTGLYLPMESVLFPEVLHRPQRARPPGLGLMALSIGGLVGALS